MMKDSGAIVYNLLPWQSGLASASKMCLKYPHKNFVYINMFVIFSGLISQICIKKTTKIFGNYLKYKL